MPRRHAGLAAVLAALVGALSPVVAASAPDAVGDDGLAVHSGAAAPLNAADGIMAVPCRDDQVVIQTRSGLVHVTAEIADTDAARRQGLMFRQDLPLRHGMLFVYDAPQPVAFWMRNTLIPLDILFIDAHGVICRLHPMATPHDLTPIPGAAPDDPQPDRLMVLEIAGGEAARLGITPGDLIAHPRLPPDSAALACTR